MFLAPVLFLQAGDKKSFSEKMTEYNDIVKKLSNKDLSIITAEKIIKKTNRLGFRENYLEDKGEYSYFPYYKYSIAKDVFHIAFACVSPDRGKSFVVIVSEQGSQYSLVQMIEFVNKDLFVSSRSENGERLLYVFFEYDTDYIKTFKWDPKSGKYENVIY